MAYVVFEDKFSGKLIQSISLNVDIMEQSTSEPVSQPARQPGSRQFSQPANHSVCP